jgi:O-acetyl-ADP-ribose deacetylase (regulator of RNase III)
MRGILSERRRSSNRYLDTVHIMPGDIAAQEVDVIVSLLPQNMEYRGQVNESLADRAGANLQGFIKEHIVEPRAGDVYAVPGFDLPCKHVLFVIRPVWRTEFDRQDKELLNACRKAMDEARRLSARTIAFPPLGSGQNGFPKTRSSRLMIQGIEDRLESAEGHAFDEVRIVCRKEDTCSIFRKHLDKR